MTEKLVARARWFVPLLVLFLAGAALVGGVRNAGAWAIAEAPSPDRTPAVDGALPSDVVAVIHAEVGHPSAILEAWILEPAEPLGTTLVLHGMNDETSMIAVGRSLRAVGQRAVLVDLSGHAASTGRWLTYGARESTDLSQLLEELDALGLIAGELHVYGPSYRGVASSSSTGSLDFSTDGLARSHAPSPLPWTEARASRL